MSRPSAGPLLLTADEMLLEELLRLTAAAGATPEVAAEPEAVMRAWARAPAVLVGADLAARTAACGPLRRAGVHVVAWAGADDALFRSALALGAEGVSELPHAEGWLVGLLTDLADEARAPGPVLAVLGGSGGVGATTLACALGQVAAVRGSCLVLDADPLGPGVDRILGVDDLPGVRWDALAHGGGRLGATSLREAVPSRDGLGVLTWPADPVSPGVAAVREALSAGRRGHDLVVVDLPRASGDLTAELASRCDRVLVVTGAGVPALAATVRTCRRLGSPDAVRLVVRGRGLDPVDVTRVTGVEVVARVPDQRGVAEAVDLGLGPLRSQRSPLARAARRTLDACLADLAVPLPPTGRSAA